MKRKENSNLSLPGNWMITKLHVNYNHVILKCSLIYDQNIVSEDQKFPSIWVVVLLLFLLFFYCNNLIMENKSSHITVFYTVYVSFSGFNLL